MANSTEKHTKLKIKILKLLPKVARALSFQNPPYSPTRPHAANKMLPMIPVEARRKPKTTDQSFESQEPSSPKVSCMGKIKNQKISCKARKKATLPAPAPRLTAPPKKRVSALRRASSIGSARNSEDAFGDDLWQNKISNEVPSLSQMKSFSSGRRDSFAEFDWSKVRPVEPECWSSYSDEEGGICEGGGGGEKTVIYFSAALVGDMKSQPRKEVNLWKRRIIAPLRPLQINK